MDDKQRLADYSSTFNTEAGGRVLKDLEDLFDNNTFNTDPYIHAYNAGQRSVVLFIRAARTERPEAPVVETGIGEELETGSVSE